MLRTVTQSHIRPRLIPLKFTITASAVNYTMGRADTSATRTGTGAATITYNTPFKRGAFVVYSQGTQNGGFCAGNEATFGVTNCKPKILNADGTTPVDGAVDAIVLGYDNQTNDTGNLIAPVKSTLDRSRIIWGRISGSSGNVIIGGSDFLCTRTGTGAYTITFKRAFGRAPAVIVTPVSASASVRPKVTNQTAAGCTVNLYDGTPNSVDAPYYICAVGTDSIQETGKCFYDLQNSQRHPRIVAFRFNMSAGVLSVFNNTSDLLSATKAATGTYDFTMKIPFKREYAVFCSTNNAGTPNIAQASSTSTTSTVQIVTRAANGSALTDAVGHTDVIIIGSDDASEY